MIVAIGLAPAVVPNALNEHRTQNHSTPCDPVQKVNHLKMISRLIINAFQASSLADQSALLAKFRTLEAPRVIAWLADAAGLMLLVGG
jgi:hypothetical protein